MTNGICLSKNQILVVARLGRPFRPIAGAVDNVWRQGPKEARSSGFLGQP